MSQPPRTLVLGDVHLTRDSSRAVASDLARFVAAHPGARLVFAGDLFDLSVAAPKRGRRTAIAEVLEAHASLRVALARHVEQDGSLWLVGGNHDADLGGDGGGDALVVALGASAAARSRVRVSPWF